jgi:hypothetical protein
VRSYFEKPFTKIGLVEWLKVKALSSSPSNGKKTYLLAALSFLLFVFLVGLVFELRSLHVQSRHSTA